MLTSSLLKFEVEELLKERQWREVRESLSDLSGPELADLCQEIETPLRPLLFRSLERERSTELFSYLEFNDQNTLLHQLTNQETRHLLSDMSPDDRTALLEELPAQITRKLLALLSPEELTEARQLLGYPEESVGRLMTPDYVYVRRDWSVTYAIEKIRLHGRDSETFNTVYVVNDRKILLDEIRLRKILLAGAEQKISDLMDNRFVSLNAWQDREAAVSLMRKHDLAALPVIDSGGILLGIVTVDDVMDVAEEEFTEDSQKGASVMPLKENYVLASPALLFQKRIIWLAGLVVLGLISAGILSYYEKTLATAVSLAMFVPLLLGTGGNTGSQSATLIIRALVTGEMEGRKWYLLALKELVVGISLGITLAAIAFVIAYFKGGIDLAWAVSLSMAAIVIFSNLLGLLVPLGLHRVGVDPAVASSPLITTMTDASGLLIYFSIAGLMVLRHLSP